MSKSLNREKTVHGWKASVFCPDNTIRVVSSVLYLPTYLFFFFFQPSFVHGWTSAFLLSVHRFCGAIEGIESFSVTLGSRRVRRVWSVRQKSLEILGIEPGPWGRQTVRFIHFPTELSWLTNVSEKKLYFLYFPNNLKQYTTSKFHSLHQIYKYRYTVMELVD